MDPMGMMGFDNAQAARADADAHLCGIPHMIVEHHGIYAWMAPMDYAERVASINGLAVIEWRD